MGDAIEIIPAGGAGELYFITKQIHYNCSAVATLIAMMDSHFTVVNTVLDLSRSDSSTIKDLKDMFLYVKLQS